jgi:hypothetical protein
LVGKEAENMNSHTHDHTPAPDAGDAMPSYYEIMETSGLLRGCLTEKKSLVKIGEPSHMSTRFFATRFFQMPARGRGGFIRLRAQAAARLPR